MSSALKNGEMMRIGAGRMSGARMTTGAAAMRAAKTTRPL